MTPEKIQIINKVWNYHGDILANRLLYLALKQVYVCDSNKLLRYNTYITPNELEEIKAFNALGEWFSWDWLVGVFSNLTNPEHIEWIDSNPYLTPKMKGMVQFIRKHDSFIIYPKLTEIGDIIPFNIITKAYLGDLIMR